MTTLRSRSRAFSLIEVMIAVAIFFMCTFAILGLTAQLLQNARVFQTKNVPNIGLVHAWYTSMTNRVTEGLTTVEFGDISTDLGDLYRDYYAELDVYPSEIMTNGLFEVTYRLYNRRTRQMEAEVLTLYFDPNSMNRPGVGGLRR
jgi:hypothetical protein